MTAGLRWGQWGVKTNVYYSPKEMKWVWMVLGCGCNPSSLLSLTESSDITHADQAMKYANLALASLQVLTRVTQSLTPFPAALR